jgi:uncharacterized protein YcbK (DUF882 family)
MKLTTNFNLPEFASKDGSAFPESVKESLAELAENLEILRAHFGKPITITSGYRSPAHNLRIGGASESFHTRGMAADIKVKEVAPKIVYNAIELLIKSGKMKEGGLGLYNSWVHYDIRGKKIRWDYTNKS